MDTTQTDRPSSESADDLLDRVRVLLQRVGSVDPAEAVEPLGEVADLLEEMLEGGDEV